MADPLNPIQQGQKDEEDNQQQANQQPVMGAQQATVQGGGMQTSQQPAAPQQKGSGRFTNLQGFLQANKNFAQKQGGLAGKMSQRIGTQVGQAQQTLAGEKQKFGQTLGNIKQEAVKTKEGIEPSLGFLGGAEGTKFAQQFERDAQGNLVMKPQQAVAQPGQMQVAVQPEQAPTPAMNRQQAEESVRKALEMKYTGPERLGSEKELEAQKQTLGELGQATASQEGRFGLLQRFFGRPTYNAGQQRLDQLLVQGNQPQLQNLLASRQKTAQFGGAFDKARGQALQDVAQTRGDVQKTAQEAKTRTGDVARQAEEQLARDVEQRNRLIQEAEMYGTQGTEELKQALAAEGLNMDDLRIALDPRSAFGQPSLASAQLAQNSVANLSNLDIERANRLNALRQLSGRTDLLQGATEEAGRDIQVGLGDELRNRIAGSRSDISAYAKAAQGAEAFTPEEEKQWRSRMVKNRVDDLIRRGSLTEAQRASAQRLGEYGYLNTEPGTGGRWDTSVDRFKEDLRQGLNSKEELVGSIRQDIGNELRRKFGFLGKAY